MGSIMAGAAMLSVGMYLALSPWTLETYLTQVLSGAPVTIFGIAFPESPGNPSHWIVGSGMALMAVGLMLLAKGLAIEIGYHTNQPPGTDDPTKQELEKLQKQMAKLTDQADTGEASP